MKSEHVSGQAPPCQVTVSWLHPRVHGLAPLRQTAPATAGPELIALSPNASPRSDTKKAGARV